MINEALASLVHDSEAEKDHTPKGLSQHGHCTLQQILQRKNPIPFTGQGATTPGTAAHEYFQGHLHSGMILDPRQDNQGKIIDGYLVIGHEQYVFLIENGQVIRQSPIDTLVFNIRNQEFEIWDFKSTRIDLKYINKADHVYELQVNLYAHLFKQANRLDYNPVGKIIYISKDNWMDIKTFEWRMRDDWVCDSLEKIHTVDTLSKTPVNIEALANQADGLYSWSDTKVPYRKQCKYCEHSAECLEILNTALKQNYASVDAVGDALKSGQKSLVV